MKKRLVFFLLIGLLYKPFYSFSQENGSNVAQITEEKEIKFQENLFKALSEKSISNYQKAIESLEICKAILPNNETVYFELSKNYLLLNKTIEAKKYIQIALELDPNNLWMLLHLVAIQKKERNYDEAIKIQRKIAKQYPNQQKALISLYYVNKEYSNALSLLNDIEKTIALDDDLIKLKNELKFPQKTTQEKKFENSLPRLISTFEKSNLSFVTLQQILEISSKTNSEVFFTYSKSAMDLFPAQPLVYLYRGKALQKQQRFQDAIDILEQGIDFVVDDSKLEGQFYTILADLYLIINNSNKAKEYLKKKQRNKY